MPQRKEILIIFALLCSMLPVVPATAQEEDTRFFPETRQYVSGRFLEFWERQGGLDVFGYPLTERRIEGGRPAQYFERARFELHAENPAPYDVLLGRIGAEILQLEDIGERLQPRPTDALGGCIAFEVTPHDVCNQEPGVGFRDYWMSNGLEFDGQPGSSFAESLALFGYPITEPHIYRNSSGDVVEAQWFERARFEWHPNNPTEFKVLLGRLGAVLLEAR